MGTRLPCPDASTSVARFYDEIASLQALVRDQFVILISLPDHIQLASNSLIRRGAVDSRLSVAFTAGQEGWGGIRRCLRTVSGVVGELGASRRGEIDYLTK